MTPRVEWLGALSRMQGASMKHNEHATDWLRRGANADEERQLGFNPAC